MELLQNIWFPKYSQSTLQQGLKIHSLELSRLEDLDLVDTYMVLYVLEKSYQCQAHLIHFD